MSSPIDWEQYRVKSPAPAQPISEPQPAAMGWEQYRVQPPESSGQAALRRGTTVASRVGERFAGLPGDIQSMQNMGLTTLAEQLNLPKVAEFTKNMRLAPTSEELRKKSEEATKGYTKPKSEREEFWTSLGADAASMFRGTPSSLVRGIGTAALKEGTKFGAETLGAGEGTKAALDLGTTIFGALFDPTKMDKYYKRMRTEAERQMPLFDINFDNAGSKLKILRSTLRREGDIKANKPVIKHIDEILGRVNSDGKLRLGDAVRVKTGINKDMGDPENLEGSKKLLLHLNKLLTRNIATAKRAHPEWYDLYRTSELGHSGVKQSQKVSDFIRSLVKANPGKLAVSALYYGVTDPSAAAKAMLGAGGAIGAIKSGELAKRLSNPTLRKYYMKAFQAGLDENKTITLHYLKKFQDALEKEKK